MPFIILIVAAVAVFALLPRGTQTPRQLPQGDTKKPLATAGGNDTQKALTAASDAFVRSGVFGDKVSAGIAKFGLALAITLSAINVMAAVAVAFVAIWLAAVVDGAIALHDMTTDNHQQGLDDYDQQWQKAYDHMHDDLTNRAMVAQQTIDPTQLDYACGAYADGFMQRMNYLRAWSAYSGGTFGVNSSNPTQGFSGVLRAWKKGLYAGTAAAYPSVKAYQQYGLAQGLTPQQAYQDLLSAANINAPALAQPQFGGLWGDRMLDISPPLARYYAQWPGQESDNPGNGIQNNPIVDTYGRMGALVANATMMVGATQQSKGVGQTELSSLAWYRDRGWFQGACLGVPQVPSNVGVSLGGTVCFTPDGKTVQFTKV